VEKKNTTKKKGKLIKAARREKKTVSKSRPKGRNGERGEKLSYGYYQEDREDTCVSLGKEKGEKAIHHKGNNNSLFSLNRERWKR